MEEPVAEEQKKLSPEYNLNHSYLQHFRQDCQDPTRLLPATSQRSFPRNGFEWLCGFTYRGTGIINIREDLQGEQRMETQIHESIHTPDEYETRRLTEWIMSVLPPEMHNYKTNPPAYIR